MDPDANSIAENDAPAAPAASAAGAVVTSGDPPAGVVLHPYLPWVWRLQATFWLNVLLVPGGAVLIGLLAGSGVVGILAALPCAALATWLGWTWATAVHRRYSVRLLDDGLMMTRGAITHRDVFVPRARIQHTEVAQGPLERRWGMAELHLHTAGTHDHVIRLPGLPHEGAVSLRDRLLDRSGRDGV